MSTTTIYEKIDSELRKYDKHLDIMLVTGYFLVLLHNGKPHTSDNYLPFIFGISTAEIATKSKTDQEFKHLCDLLVEYYGKLQKSIVDQKMLEPFLNNIVDGDKLSIADIVIGCFGYIWRRIKLRFI